MESSQEVKYFVKTNIISKIEDDPRDKLLCRSQDLRKKSAKAIKKYRQTKNEYWSSLAKPKRPYIPKTAPVFLNTNKIKNKKSWSIERTNELAKPKVDFYEFTEQLKITKRFLRPSNIGRINELAIPRMTPLDVNQNMERLSASRKVPLSMLLPRLERLSIPPKRNDMNEINRYDHETFSSARRKVPLSMLLPRLERLSIPPKRNDINEIIRPDHETFSVKKSALKFVASDRLIRLATPRPVISNWQ
ncbi:Testicular haploid expressed repeat [Cinara cedri]|uniref:Testicular haploid expressed repeat n=1 Tax=Cinara cedri TaxID=506608 RepID=A0A5E4N335_9HEMI|nr:Testicular haploid expressed repeat [Cinara cedri]